MKYFVSILVLLLSFFAISPILNQGFFPIHDNTQVARVFEMAKSLRMGMFPVRWVLDLGYGLGYPIFNFYAPLSYYFGGFLNLIGFDALSATKIMMVFGIILSAVTMYLLVKELFGELAGVVASIFYVYAPFHAVDIYVRGDVAEFWAYAFIPLVFYGLWKIYKEGRWRYIEVGAIGYAGIILSHNLTAMMVTPFILFFTAILTIFAFRNKKTKTVKSMLLSLLLGVVLSCFYWLPAILEMKNTNVLSVIGGGSNYVDHFVCVNQLWTSSWGFGGSSPGCIDGVSFMIGKLHIIFSFLSIIGLMLLFVFKKYKTEKEKIIIIAFSFFGFIFSVFLTLDISKIIWQSTPLMAFFQFPWRFLLMISFFSSILSGSFIWLITNIGVKKYAFYLSLMVSMLMVISVILLDSKFFVSQKILQVDSSFYTNELALKWTTSKISDEYLPKNIKKPKNSKEALLNKQTFSFKQTPIENIANIISLTGIIIVIIGIISTRKKAYHA